MEKIAQKIPITILTGFLGSGKTTLLTNLLRQANGKRIAVIVNEFGEIGVDGELLQSCGCPFEEGDIIELANGCLCCTVQEEFYPTLKSLLEREIPPEHIVIETSGLALPKPLLQAVRWPDVKPYVTVDAVVTTVDSLALSEGRVCDIEKVEMQRQMDDSLDHETPLEELFEDQLQCADLVLLTKTDLVASQEIDKVTSYVKRKMRHHEIPVIHITNGSLRPEILYGIQSAAEDDLESRPSHHDHHHHEDEEDHHHHHDDGYTSFVFTTDKAFEAAKWYSTLKSLQQSFEIYRIKGFIEVPGKNMRMVLQGVGNRLDHYYDRPWHKDETRVSKLVFIGYEIDEKALKINIEEWLSGSKHHQAESN